MTSARRGFSPLRDIPTVLWLAAAVGVALAHSAVPVPRWLMIHLVLLGAVSHSILVWSQHFADALLRTRPRARSVEQLWVRLAVLNTGAVLVVVGVVAGRWWVTATGGVAIVVAAGLHSVLLARQVRASLPARFGATVRFYVVAAALLPFGVAVGAVLARDTSIAAHERLHIAHVLVNVLGWVGLTVLGTLVTLWPTVVGARIEQAKAALAMRALPVLAPGVIAAALGAAGDQRHVLVAGLTAYLVGVGMVLVSVVSAARARPPVTYAALSIAAGVVWWCGCLVVMVWRAATGSTWGELAGAFDSVAPFLAAGFAAQLLIGALSYLVPVALGGGPASARVAHREFDRGAHVRLVVINAGLVVCASPVPPVVRVAASMAVLAALAAFLVLLARATAAWRASRTATESAAVGELSPGSWGADGEVSAPWHARPRGQRAGMAAAGLAIVALAVAAGVAIDPAPIVASVNAGPLDEASVPTGRTVEVTVVAEGMRFTPDVITVEAGDRLVITLENADATNVHDLVLDSGASTRRLAPGDTEVLDLGVVGRGAEGWCSVLGHRSMGMELTIVVSGAGQQSSAATGDHVAPHGDETSGDDAANADAAAALDFMARPGAGFRPWDATLAPASDATVHRRTLTVTEVEREVAAGVTQTLWTFDGQAPGPTLRGKIGDTFEITLVNDGTIGHSMDFHAGALAPDDVMRTIAPGESLTYTFTAERAGIWMYHCSTMPMSAHIANGMYGAVIIDPPDLAPVDREFVIVQGEYYLGEQGGIVNMDKVDAEQPDAVVFNGYANQYDAVPLQVTAGERVRVWVLAAGPNRGTSFHVVGGQFDTVFAEGSYLLEQGGTGGTGGAQALGLTAAQGGFVELVFPEQGHYPFVSHVMVDAERGAHGVFDVRPRD